MGLDMYLEADEYTSRYYHPEKYNMLINSIPSLKKNSEEVDMHSVTLTNRVGYWRKANAIHNWFVENVQGGKDECQRSYVTKEQLLDLKATCQSVLDNHELAGELLPPTSGFFFGTTDLDEWYFDSLRETIEIVDRALEDIKDGSEIYYQSSW